MATTVSLCSEVWRIVRCVHALSRDCVTLVVTVIDDCDVHRMCHVTTSLVPGHSHACTYWMAVGCCTGKCFCVLSCFRPSVLPPSPPPPPLAVFVCFVRFTAPMLHTPNNRLINSDLICWSVYHLVIGVTCTYQGIKTLSAVYVNPPLH